MAHFTMPIRGDKLSVNVQIREHLLERQTDFQRIDIYDTEVLGRVLLLDGHIQLAEMDERAYHELLVQVPLLSVPNPRRALVIGGGDGGAIRELCRHESLETIDMVEIDAGVVEASREFLPRLADGAFEDPRVNLHLTDAFEFVKADLAPYDLIVSDSTDVYEGESGNLSEMLFTEPFYRDLFRLLSPDGFLVTQADNFVFCPYSLDAILGEFGKVFPQTGSYVGLVPSFGGYSGFAFASHGATLAEDLPATSVPLVYLTPETYALARSNVRFA